jgi:integrase
VTKTGGKSWIFRYHKSGRRRDMGLGTVALCTLAEARNKAIDARRLIASGLDPIEHRQSQVVAAKAAKAATFEACVEDFIAARQAGWKKPRYAAEKWRRVLVLHAYPVLGKLPVQAIDMALVLQVLRPHWEIKTRTGVDLRGKIEMVLDFARAHGRRSGENPARWKGLLDAILPKPSKVHQGKHYPALHHAEIADLLRRVQQPQWRFAGDGTTGDALIFTILTAARRSESIGARWSEVDLTRRVWTVPAERMKMGREHRVPLSTAALDVLATMAAVREGDFVFPGRVPGSPIAPHRLGYLLHRLGYHHTAATVHGFRSSFRSWAAESGVAEEIAEKVLAHVSEPVERAYQRSDLLEPRRAVMERWGRYCTEGPAEIIPLRTIAQS